MKLKILGCGTSTGVPVPGCQCTVCTSSHPRNQRTRPSAVIELDNGSNILIDTSPDLRSQVLRWGIKRVDAVLFTHAHADHILGLDDLRGFNFATRSSIPCYGSATTLKEIRRFYDYVFNPDPNYIGGALPQVSTHEIDEVTPFELCGLKITPFKLLHGRLPVTGFLIGNTAYATDCNFIPIESKELIRGVNTLILDGLRYEPHATHFTIPQAVAAAQELEAKMTYLIHTTHTVDYEETNSKLPPNVQLAHDGLEVSIT